jgi:Flp pilus assembly protein CpaB
VTRRGRLLATAGAASVAAITGAVTVIGYTDSVSDQFGSLRPVVVATTTIERGGPLTSQIVQRSMEVRRIPSRFVPAGTLTDRSGAIGLEAAVDLPSGTYISSVLLRPPGSVGRRPRPAARPGLHPVEVTVQGAGAIPPGGGRFDVLVTPLDDRGETRRTRVVSRSATIVTRFPVDRSGPGAITARVTLAVPRKQAIRLIDAEARGERLTLLAVGDQ